MKKSRFTEEQIAFALRQAETGTKVSEVCRKMGVAEPTFYNWKKKYGGLGVSELRCLKQLEEPIVISSTINHQIKGFFQRITQFTPLISRFSNCHLQQAFLNGGHLTLP